MHKLRGNFFVNSYVKARFLTHDPERIKSFDADPLIARADRRQHPAGALRDGGARRRGRPRHHHPDAAPDLRRRLRRASRAAASLLRAPRGARSRSAMCCRASTTTRSARGSGPSPSTRRAASSSRASPSRSTGRRCSHADRIGFTRDEADALASPLPLLSPRGLFWAMARLNMTIGGLLSDGIRLGHRTGFDSGSTLDYVYRNKPSGRRSARPPDRQGLSASRSDGAASASERSISRSCCARRWSGSRERGDAGARPRHRGGPRPLRARSTRGASTIKPESVLLRDYSDINVESRPRADRARRVSTAIAQFVKGDAFDRDEPRRGRAEARRSASSPACTSCSPTTAWCRALARRARRGDSRPAAICSTPASPGIRSSS